MSCRSPAQSTIRVSERNKNQKSIVFTCAVAGEAEPWRASPRPSSEDLTSLTSSHSASSSTLLVLTAEGSSHTEAVGARKAWRLTSTRWHEVTSRSGDFLVSLACLAQSFSERAESGLNEKTLGNFFRRWGWFLAVHPETDTRLRLQLARTEREHFNWSLRNYPAILTTYDYLKSWPGHDHPMVSVTRDPLSDWPLTTGQPG